MVKSPLRRFWTQPRKDYRNFQIAYAVLAAQSLALAAGFLWAPDAVVDGFVRLGGLMGGEYYPLYERSYLWRMLAAAQVMTPAFICVFLQLDIKRHWAALYPLIFIRAVTAAAYLAVFAAVLTFPAFFAAAVWDIAAGFILIYFARAGRRAAQEDHAVLVPRALGWL